MSLILFVDNFIATSFLFSPAIAKYVVSRYYSLDNDKVFWLVQCSILGFIAVLFYGGILGSDIGIPDFSWIYPAFLLAYNFIFYAKYRHFSRILAVSLTTVFLLNFTFETNVFVHEILYGDWIPANLLFGMIPMHPFMWIYVAVAGGWLFQLARIKLTKGSLLLVALILLSSFIPDSYGIFSTSLTHHFMVSSIQFFLYIILIIHWGRLKIESKVIANAS